MLGDSVPGTNWGPPITRAGFRGLGDLDFRLGQQGPFFRLGAGVSSRLSAWLAQRSRGELRARWHGYAGKVTACSWSKRGQPRPSSHLPSARPPLLTGPIAHTGLGRPAKPGRGPAAALLTHNPVAQQLLTLGLIKSISPSILIQLLSTAIRWVTE